MVLGEMESGMYSSTAKFRCQAASNLRLNDCFWLIATHNDRSYQEWRGMICARHAKKLLLMIEAIRAQVNFSDQ